MAYDRKHGPLHRQPRNVRAARTITIPTGVSPHVQLFFSEMKRQGRSYDALAEASGVTRAAQKAWRVRTYPSLTSIEAALGALGWSFVPVPAAEVLPPDLSTALAALAAKMQAEIPEVWTALMAVSLQQREGREKSAYRLAQIDAAHVSEATETAKVRRRTIRVRGLSEQPHTPVLPAP